MSCKQAKRDLASVVREERTLRAKVKAANAEVATAVKQLPPLYVTTASAVAQRERVKPLIDRAQDASNKWFDANARLVNKRANVAHVCKKG